VGSVVGTPTAALGSGSDMVALRAEPGEAAGSKVDGVEVHASDTMGRRRQDTLTVQWLCIRSWRCRSDVGKVVDLVLLTVDIVEIGGFVRFVGFVSSGIFAGGVGHGLGSFWAKMNYLEVSQIEYMLQRIDARANSKHRSMH
jgi:hypothetical protein